MLIDCCCCCTRFLNGPSFTSVGVLDREQGDLRGAGCRLHVAELGDDLLWAIGFLTQSSWLKHIKLLQ